MSYDSFDMENGDGHFIMVLEFVIYLHIVVANLWVPNDKQNLSMFSIG